MKRVATEVVRGPDTIPPTTRGFSSEGESFPTTAEQEPAIGRGHSFAGVRPRASDRGRVEVAGAIAASQPVRPPSSERGVVQCRAIHTAGLELELKGVDAIRENDMEFPPGAPVLKRTNWHIEVDERNPELVTHYTERAPDLFSWLEEGRRQLVDIQKAAKEPEEDEQAERPEASGAPFAGKLRSKPGLENYAKPQITFGVAAGAGLDELSQLATSDEKINYRRYHVPQRDASGLTGFKGPYRGAKPRVNEGGAGFYGDFNPEGLAGFEEASPAVKGLLRMTVLTVGFALSKGEYYKARFSLMPRTALSAMFEGLEEKDQLVYSELLGSWLDSHDEDVGHRRLRDDSGYNTMNMEDVLKSIVDSGSRLPKGAGEDRTLVDAIASSRFAQGASGASVGAYPLPKGSGGIFEVRNMPYVKIEDGRRTATVYEDIIRAYGGMG